MQRPDEEARYDRLAVRLSVIISRLMAGETLTLQTLSGEFGVSIRTLRRDLHQRLVHLDIIGRTARIGSVRAPRVITLRGRFLCPQYRYRTHYPVAEPATDAPADE
jgi:hypothetical protein